MSLSKAGELVGHVGRLNALIITGGKNAVSVAQKNTLLWSFGSFVGVARGFCSLLVVGGVGGQNNASF